MTQVQNKKPYSRRPVTRKEIALIVGRRRTFHPVLDGRVYFIAVQVAQRTDTRTQLFDYLPGYASMLESDLKGEPERSALEFYPRIAVSHDDLPDFIDVLTDAHERVADTITKQQGLLNRL